MKKSTSATLICVQPSIRYYAWQVEVMLTNFEELGIHKRHSIQCLFAYNKNEEDWREKVELITRLQFKFSDVASFFFYQDTREYPVSYISSIRPNVLKQHFERYPELSQAGVFYHDCDIIFSKYPDFLEVMAQSGPQWYVSDTISYIGYEYIVSKGHDVLDLMCQITGCHPYLVRDKQGQSGGAQYFMRGVDYQFFHKMEKDCEKMYAQVTELNNKKKAVDPSHHELQIWCADMWCLLWGAWMRGYDTLISPELGFCWATDPVEKFDQHYIFHNAGVTSKSAGTFYKGAYTNQLPYDESDSGIDPKFASSKYFNLMKTTGQKTCLR